MADEILVPVTVGDAAIANAAEHATITQTEDEDYRWLTDRLDALQTEVTLLRTERSNKDSEILSAFQLSQESNQTNLSAMRTIIESQTQMIQTLTANLTALSESALLRSLPINSTNSLPDAQQNTTLETAEQVPANVVAIAEPDAAAAGSAAGSAAKKRQRI